MTHKIYYECSISIKFPQYVTKVVFFMTVWISLNYWIKNVNLYGVLINNCHFEHFAPIFVRGQNGSEGVGE